MTTLRVLLRQCHRFRNEHMKNRQIQERTNFTETRPLPASNSVPILKERFKFRAPIQCDCAENHCHVPVGTIDENRTMLIFACVKQHTDFGEWNAAQAMSSVVPRARSHDNQRVKSVNTRNRMMQLTKDTTTQIMTQRIPHRILCYRRSPRNSGRFKNDATKIK